MKTRSLSPTPRTPRTTPTPTSPPSSPEVKLKYLPNDRLKEIRRDVGPHGEGHSHKDEAIEILNERDLLKQERAFVASENNPAPNPIAGHSRRSLSFTFPPPPFLSFTFSPTPPPPLDLSAILPPGSKKA